MLVEIKNFARNMNISAIPSTKANLDLFFRSRMKEFKDEEQNGSLERAMYM